MSEKKNSPKKKPVYDARKAIEEAKLREAKEGKKEKHYAFREFVREKKKAGNHPAIAKPRLTLLTFLHSTVQSSNRRTNHSLFVNGF